MDTNEKRAVIKYLYLKDSTRNPILVDMRDVLGDDAPKFAHKFIHHPKLLPEVFINNNFFTFNEEIHNYETRTKTNIHLHHSNTTSGLRTIKHKAAVLWNELPPSIQNIKSISNFKIKIKMYLLTKEY